MERFTEKDDKEYITEYKLKLKKDFRIVERKGNLTLYGRAVTKLGEYEDTEEKGLLLRLPCKIGESVYYIIEDRSDDENVNGYVVTHAHQIIDVCKKGFFTGDAENFPYHTDFTPWDEIGKTAFFTKIEANAKLVEMAGKINEKKEDQT